MGLLGMQERVSLVGGELEIVSAPGRGTDVRARFGVQAGKAD
jgi:signal transduction histidine kinase